MDGLSPDSDYTSAVNQREHIPRRRLEIHRHGTSCGQWGLTGQWGEGT